MTRLDLFRSLLAVVAISAALRMPKASADDWPQWQGPSRNSMSSEKGLLQEWPADGPLLVRKITGLGGGDSAPSIANGRIYGMGNLSNEEVVLGTL